jgi:hypothetical protein
LAQLQKVERLEAHEPPEVEAQSKKTRKIYFIITIEYVPKSFEYVPRKRKFLNKNK